LKWSKASVAAVVLILTVGAILPSAAPLARGSNQTWAPYGPQINNIQFQYYDNSVAENTAFQLGQLDVMDTQIAPCRVFACFFNPDVNLSPHDPTDLFYNIGFNYAGSTWAFWGCDWQHGNSACGVEIRQAFAHLIDKASFISDSSLQGAANPLADEVPGTMLAANGTMVATPPASQCLWDTLEAGTLATPVYPAGTPNPINPGYSSKYGCLSAFHLALDPTGFAAPGSPDFCAAVDHIMMANMDTSGAMGLRRDPAAPLDAFGNHCGIDPSSPGLSNIVAHPMRALVRSSQPRKDLGVSFANALNQLFAGNTVNRFLFAPPFTCFPGTGADCWDWYTFGYSDSNPFPMTGLYSSYDSQFAPPPCTYPCFVSGTNAISVAIPSLDSALSASVSTSDANAAYNEVFTALGIMGGRAVDIPIYNPTFQTAALTSVAGVVNQVGVGFSNQWTNLFAHKSSYLPMNPMYQFDGGGVPTTLRSGQSRGGIVANLSPYFAEFPEEFNLLYSVYDTLFAQNPTLPTQVFCWMCSSYTQSVDSSGNTHYLVELRQDLRWQDGVPVDAKDVKFSLLTQRDFAVTFGSVSSVLDVKILSSDLLDIVVQGQSLDQLATLASAPIIPRHIWELPGDLTYGDVGTVDPAKLDPSYDPVASGTFIGSGPFMCSSVFPEDLGRVGTGCIVNPDGTRGSQFIPSGSTAALTRYDLTLQPGTVDPFLQWFRSYDPNWGTGSGTAAFSGQFQEFSWADRYDNAQVTTQDLASVAACYGKSSPSGCADYSYWLVSAFHPGTPNTISTEVTVVASHLDDSWVYPFSWNGNQTMQPGPQIQNIVPYNS
jgi:ABC-type transport system substrate-binding protein